MGAAAPDGGRGPGGAKVRPCLCEEFGEVLDSQQKTAQGPRLDHHETVPHVPIIMRIMVDVTMTAHDDGR